MKRRLTRAYDSMTMPDGCANTIERKLTEQLDARMTGTYIQTAAPTPVRRHGWVVGLAAVCLMLVLSVGGTMLFLGMSGAQLGRQKETVARFEETEAAPTPEDHYRLATTQSAETIETFAKVVRSNILTENWTALADKIQYPISIEGHDVKDQEAFVTLMEETVPGSHFLLGMEYESCTAMFCSQQGICMGDDLIWINETWDRKLKITAINHLLTESEKMGDFSIRITGEGTGVIDQYTGSEETVDFPQIAGNAMINAIGTGRRVILNGDRVRSVTIHQSVTEVGDYAFADCPALEAVYFRGDAPPQAEGVFDGSENVIVYYNAGTKSWGETWCGRKTQSCVTTSIYLGTASVLQDQKKANLAYLDVLSGKGTFWCDEFEANLTVEKYCQKRGEAEGTAVSISRFTLLDMDRNDLKELVFRVDLEDGGSEDYLILAYTEAGEGMVYCYMEPQRKMTDLRKDGSFWWREAGPGQGESRLMSDPEKGSGMVLSGFSVQGESPAAQWHSWPCVRPELVLQSYEWAGTGQSRMPSTTYYTFEGLVMGTTANDWTRLKEDLTRMGMICLEDEGTISVFDPDAPGTCLYGTLTNEKGIVQLADVGYYICTEEKEYAAEIRQMRSGTPEYWEDAYLPALDSMGRRVFTPEELLAYLS